MAVELTMPALSPTMEKGTLAKWLVKVGDSIKPGDLLAEIETDKATMEYEAIDEGVIASILIPEGSQDVPVGTVLATVADADEAVAAPAMETTEAVTAAAAAAAAVAAPPPVAAAPAPVADPVPAPLVPAPASDKVAVNATPLARRIATMRGLSLLGIAGTGARGRIVKADLGLPSLLAPTAAAATGASVIISAPAYDPPAGVPVETVRLSTMRKTIARRLTEAKQNIPHFYLTARCNIDALNRLRGELNAGLAARGVKLSVNDMLIKALALAMTAVPDVNVQFGGDVLHRFARADISMAVAIEDGLVTPVIREADSLSLSAIAQTSKALAIKARDGKLVPEDYQGGTASISNLGMFGINEMFPVINPPHALILGVAAGVEQPWKVGHEIALATIMAATASFDHRAIDGATAAQFMAALRDLIESPLQIVS
jgi:pyruvate dehydrogenase E2 component (dihydrolipoamide acetyltransferase)